MNTSENIKRLRKQNKMTQTELALKVGYTDRSSIAKIEAGQVDLSETKIAQFAKVLGTTPSELMGLGAEAVQMEADIEEACAILRDMPPEARALALASVKGIALQAQSQDSPGGSV